MTSGANSSPGEASAKTCEPPLQLVAFGCSHARLDDYLKTLRNAGLAVHGSLAADPEDLGRRAAEPACDLALLTSPDSPSYTAAVAALTRAAPERAFLVLAKDPSAHLEHAGASGARDVIPAGRPDWLVFAVRRELDALHARRELASARARLAEAEARSNALIAASRDAIAYLHEGMHVDANRSYLELLGLKDSDDIEGLPVMDLVVPAERRRFREVLHQVEEQRLNREVETRFVKAAGEPFLVRIECSPASVDGEACVQVVIRDAQRLEERLARLSSRDPLTGLLNRQTFAERLEQALEATGPLPATAVLIGITNFVAYQEAVGLPRGDELLRQVALTLSATVGGEVRLARFADHEFALLCAPARDAEALTRRCLEMLPPASGQGPPPTYNAGIAAPTQPAVVGAADWLHRASRALRRAEALGPGALFRYAPGPPGDEAEAADASLLQLIDDALDNDRLYLRYQPIVSLRGDAREHYAVTVRLLNRNDTEVFPDDFLNHGSHADRLAEIDRWVVRTGIGELARQRRRGRKAVFFVSLSRAAVASESMLLWVCDCLRECQANGAWLVFQFREADLAAVSEPAKRLMDGLRKINCRIAVSHYTGRGRCAELLPLLPVDAVKLHPSFLTDLTGDIRRQRRLRETRQQLHELGIKTIATAVEEPQSLSLLWHAGVHYVQGFLLQRPTRSIEPAARTTRA